MHRRYTDILDRIPEPPRWFDEYAVPRYCDFSPIELANIYAQEAALVLNRCQGCRREFQVAFSELNTADDLWSKDRSKKLRNISDLIGNGKLQYGDPPNLRCCAAGPTRGSSAVRVLQYWYKPVIRGQGVSAGPNGPRGIIDRNALNFQRDPSFEITLPER